MVTLEAYSKIRYRSIFTLIPSNYVNTILDNSRIESFSIGQVINGKNDTDNLYVLVEGVVDVINRETKKIVESIKPGRSIELKSFLSKQKNWKYDWLSSTPVTLMLMPQKIMFEIFEGEAKIGEYLNRITIFSEFQKIKNDLRLLGLDNESNINVIASFVEKDLSELIPIINTHDLPPEEAEAKINSKIPPFLIIIKDGSLTVKKHFSNDDCKTLGEFIISDYLVLSPAHQCQYIYEQGTKAWVLEISSEAEAGILPIGLYEDLGHILPFLNPIESKIFEIDAKKRTETEKYDYQDETFYEEDKDDGLTAQDFIVDDKEKKKLNNSKFVWMLQHDQMDCGAACMTMISRFYKKNISLQTWRALVQVTKEGASVLSIKKAAERVGFDTIGVMTGYKALLKVRTPFIALMQYHFVVVYKVEENQITVADPGTQISVMTKNEFMNDFSSNCLLMKPNSRLKEYPASSPTFGKYAKLFKGMKLSMMEILIASIIIFIFELANPLFMQFIFDNVLVSGNVSMLNMVAFSIVGLNLLTSFTVKIRASLLLNLTTKLDIKFGSLFMRHTLMLPLSYYAVRNVGDITTRLEEIEKIRNFFTGKFIITFINFLSVFIYSAILYLYHPSLLLILAAFMPPLIIVNRRFFKKVVEVMNKSFKIAGKTQSITYEQIKSITTLKSLGAALPARLRWEESFLKQLDLRKAFEKLNSTSQATSILFKHAISLSILGYSAHLYLGGYLTLGKVVAISALTASIIEPLIELVQQWDDFSKVFVSLERVDDIFTSTMETKPTNDERQEKFESGDIEFNNVVFQYGNDNSPLILNGVSLSIKAGETVAFVGPSGSGKTTLAYMINLLYPPTKGKILINGHDAKDIPLTQLRKLVGMIIQENSIFAGTIYENITFGDPAPSMDRAVHAANMADAHNFIVAMKQGYMSKLGENGAGVSGGQKQRINIARALYRDPDILIMDEATSALDALSEKIVVNNIKSRGGKKTTIIVAHRMNTIMYADKIHVLKNGKLRESGSHRELMSQQGIYYEMFKKQLNL